VRNWPRPVLHRRGNVDRFAQIQIDGFVRPPPLARPRGPGFSVLWAPRHGAETIGCQLGGDKTARDCYENMQNPDGAQLKPTHAFAGKRFQSVTYPTPETERPHSGPTCPGSRTESAPATINLNR